MSLTSGLLNQTIDSIYSISKDGYGDTTTTLEYSDTQCRWQESIEQDITIGGELVEYDVEMWILPNITIEKGYRVSKDSNTYVVQKTAKKFDLDGHWDYTKVWLK